MGDGAKSPQNARKRRFQIGTSISGFCLVRPGAVSFGERMAAAVSLASGNYQILHVGKSDLSGGRRAWAICREIGNIRDPNRRNARIPGA